MATTQVQIVPAETHAAWIIDRLQSGSPRNLEAEIDFLNNQVPPDVDIMFADKPFDGVHDKLVIPKPTLATSYVVGPLPMGAQFPYINAVSNTSIIVPKIDDARPIFEHSGRIQITIRGPYEKKGDLERKVGRMITAALRVLWPARGSLATRKTATLTVMDSFLHLNRINWLSQALDQSHVLQACTLDYIVRTHEKYEPIP